MAENDNAVDSAESEVDEVDVEVEVEANDNLDDTPTDSADNDSKPGESTKSNPLLNAERQSDDDDTAMPPEKTNTSDSDNDILESPSVEFSTHNATPKKHVRHKSKSSAPQKKAARRHLHGRHSIKIGIGIPTCSYSMGIVEGMECVNFTSRFSWVNAMFVYQLRINRWFQLGGGIMPSYVSLASIQGFGAHFLLEGTFIFVPDWLYAGMQIIGGFPLLAAYDVFVGHKIKVGKRTSVVIENHFVAMAIAGFYSHWQPFIGVNYRF